MISLFLSHTHKTHTTYTLITAGTNGRRVHAAGTAELGRRSVRDHEENFERFYGGSVVK